MGPQPNEQGRVDITETMRVRQQLRLSNDLVDELIDKGLPVQLSVMYDDIVQA